MHNMPCYLAIRWQHMYSLCCHLVDTCQYNEDYIPWASTT